MYEIISVMLLCSEENCLPVIKGHKGIDPELQLLKRVTCLKNEECAADIYLQVIKHTNCRNGGNKCCFLLILVQ